MPYMQKANYEELLQMLPHKWKKGIDIQRTIDECILEKRYSHFL